ncbi:MAG: MBL fold metallo-hydrolase [Desulfobulbaceae bacterium]|nr:MBL fold metallo-hydrolase [Desulfobulbaceae bacterium]
MKKFLPAFLLFWLCLPTFAQALYEKDVLDSATGDLVATFLGHGSLMLEFNREVIQIDPWGQAADYAFLPKADLVLITHDHPDHLDKVALNKTRQPASIVIISESCRQDVPDGQVMKNGEARMVAGIGIKALPAYNLLNKRGNGEPYHPKGVGNGYLLTFNKTRVYIAGDTENIPEMADLKDIDYAFLPMNLPYTMTPEMVAAAVRTFKPKVLYPYHYGDTDPAKLVELLKDLPGVEVRIRRMK